MTPLRVLLVDDETPARSRLARLLGPLVDDERIDTVDEAEDGVAALRLLEAADPPYDLAFLDVRMPELDGFEVLDRVSPEHRPDVVFTTAYDEYALRAFEANATDYLLKPINADRLTEAVSRVEARRARGDDPGERLAALLDTLDEPSGPRPPREVPLERFSIQGVDRLFVVDVRDLLTAEVHDGIASLYVLPSSTSRSSETRHIVSFTLDALESRLDPEAFMRVHRNAIVHLARVREMIPWFSGRYKIVLDGGHEVIASRTRSRELKERLSL